MGLEDAKLKSTLKEPTDAGKNLETRFSTSLKKNGVNPHVIKEDEKLEEDDKSLKQKIFALDKMEALVYGDPKLSALYDKLAVSGKETYGYHWNETLMNILFNDYILHSPKYLQKYKMSVPKEKKRRDDSGINQLKDTIRKDKGLPPEEEPKKVEPVKAEEGFDIQRDGVIRTEKKFDTMEEPIKDNVEETTGAVSSGAFTGPLETESKIDETTTSASSGAYATPVAWSKSGKTKKQAPLWKGGQILESAKSEGNYLTDPTAFKEYYASLNEDFTGFGENDEPMMGQMEGMNSPDDDSRVPIDEFGNLFGNITNVNNKISQILANNKDLFKSQKTLPAGMEDGALVKNFGDMITNVKNMGGVKALINNSEDERYAQFLVSLLANYSVLVERGLNQHPQVAAMLKDLKTIIDPSLLKSMGEGVNEDGSWETQQDLAQLARDSESVRNNPENINIAKEIANTILKIRAIHTQQYLLL
ncbi:MAG: hypothetical protein HC836_15705 [Richelia sp. RM2_1_2]|nr:hypothetical protein [Richelia sp. RM2_1_2]